MCTKDGGAFRIKKIEKHMNSVKRTYTLRLIITLKTPLGGVHVFDYYAMPKVLVFFILGWQVIHLRKHRYTVYFKLVFFNLLFFSMYAGAIIYVEAVVCLNFWMPHKSCESLYVNDVSAVTTEIMITQM